MSAFIYNVTFDAKEPRTLGQFWSAVTSYSVADERDDFVRLRAPDERGADLVDPPLDGKPRWREGNGTRWVVLQDPEGNEFCLG